MKITDIFNVNRIKLKDYKPVKELQQIKADNFKPVPCNPHYWQNSLNINFKSRSSAENHKNQEFINKSYEKMTTSLIDYLKSEDIPESGICGYIEGMSLASDIDEAEKESLIDETIKALLENKWKCGLFNLFCDKDCIIKPLNSTKISKTIIDSNEVAKKLLEYCNEEINSGKSIVLLCNPNFFNNIAECLDGDNIEDFINLCRKQGGISNADIITNDYYNPCTKKFDIALYKERCDLSKYLTGDYTIYDTVNIIRSCIENTTGKISPIPRILIKYLFGSQPSIMEQIKKIAKVPQKNENEYLKNCLKQDVDTLIETLKNNEGKFEETNLKYVIKIISEDKKEYSSYDAFNDYISSLKDKNGIIDKDKYKLGKRVLKETNSYSSALEFVQSFSEHFSGNVNIGKKIEILNLMKKIAPLDRLSADTIKSILKNYIDESGKINQEEFDSLVSISNKLRDDNRLYEMLSSGFIDMYRESDDNKKFITELLEYPNCSLQRLKDIYPKIKDKENKFPDHIKDKIKDCLNKNISLMTFYYIYGNCLSEVNREAVCDENQYKRGIELAVFIKNQEFLQNNANYIVQIANRTFNPSQLSFSKKLAFLNELTTIKKNIEKSGQTGFQYIDTEITNLKKLLGATNEYLPITKEDRNNFIANVLKVNPKDKTKLTNFEEVMINSIPALEEMKNGLPLEYSREEFLRDLTEICKTGKNAMSAIGKTKIYPITKGYKETFEITGYNGLIDLSELNKENETENAIYNCMYKFLYRNEVKTENKKLDRELNYIIKAFPEFINTIGKKQHSTHNYTLDVHQLLMLCYSINNPEYLKLNPQDKIALKMACIMHDITKAENAIDKVHQNTSSVAVSKIIKKILKNKNQTDRIYELIKNHHWLEEFNKTYKKDGTAMRLSFAFRRPGDFKIAKIMAEADLKAVSKGFYEEYGYTLQSGELERIEKNIQTIHSTGQAVFANYIIEPKKIKKYTHNGQEYRVINLNEISDEEDMYNYGFQHIKKKDLKLLVHMVQERHLGNQLQDAAILVNPENCGIFSESIITPSKTNTYEERNYGLLLSQANTDTITAAEENQCSGNKKELIDILEEIFNEQKNKERIEYKNLILNELEKYTGKITDDEYAEFFNGILAKIKSVNEIIPEKEYKIGSKRIKGKDLIKSLEKAEEKIINPNTNKHNEIVGYLPNIIGLVAKCKTLDECHEEFLKFAKQNDYPIILI